MTGSPSIWRSWAMRVALAVFISCAVLFVVRIALRPALVAGIARRSWFDELRPSQAKVVCSTKDYDIVVAPGKPTLHDRVTAPRGRTVAKPTKIGLALRTPFQVLGNGKLVIAPLDEPGSGDHLTAFDKLMITFRRSPEGIEVASIAHVRGRVRISSQDDALALCRLRTFEPTALLLHEEQATEIVGRSKLTLGYCFGSSKHYKELIGQPSGYMGIVDDTDLSRLGMQNARCCPNSVGFEVRRTLLARDPIDILSYQILDVIENVGYDGSYSYRIVKRRPAPRPKGLRFHIPLPG